MNDVTIDVISRIADVVMSHLSVTIPIRHSRYVPFYFYGRGGKIYHRSHSGAPAKIPHTLQWSAAN